MSSVISTHAIMSHTISRHAKNSQDGRHPMLMLISGHPKEGIPCRVLALPLSDPLSDSLSDRLSDRLRDEVHIAHQTTNLRYNALNDFLSLECLPSGHTAVHTISAVPHCCHHKPSHAHDACVEQNSRSLMCRPSPFPLKLLCSVFNPKLVSSVAHISFPPARIHPIYVNRNS